MNLISKNKKSGITLIALVITIVIMLIIASIATYYGTETIKKADLETIRTNMLLINAKAKEYCEEANFKLGTGAVPEEQEELNKYLEPGIKYLNDANGEDNKPELSNNVTTTDYDFLNGTSYQFICQLKESQEALKTMGLKSIEHPENYIMAFDIKNNQVEIFYIPGVETEKDGNKVNVYSLSDIEKI